MGLCRVVDFDFVRFYTSSKSDEKSCTKQIIRKLCAAQHQSLFLHDRQEVIDSLSEDLYRINLYSLEI